METPLLVGLIAVPAVVVVIALFLVMWRERTSSQTATVAVVSALVLAAWLAVTGFLGSSGVYLPPVTGGPPPVGVQLVIALLVLGTCLIASPSLRSLLGNQKNLIRLNVWRLLGAVFLALAATGQVPALWALPAGLGDVFIGAAAFWVANGLDAPGGKRRAVIFNLLGLLDLAVAVGLGIATSPGTTQLFHTTPTAELLTHFPLVLVPTFLVPLAITLHLVSLRQLYRGSWIAGNRTATPAAR